MNVSGQLQSWWKRLTQPRPRWRLIGYDTFADEYYELPGTYPTREAAAVAERAGAGERAQPTKRRDVAGQGVHPAER